VPPERKKLLLRLDPAVHDALARWAGDELRSTNSQIEFLLRRALSEAGRLPGNLGRIRRPGRPAAGTMEGAAEMADDPEPGPTEHTERTMNVKPEEA
jgi:hypothetical protein